MDDESNTARVGPRSAYVYNDQHEKTAAFYPPGTKILPGLRYEGAFDENGQPIGKVEVLFLCTIVDTGEEVWLNADDLQLPEAA
jgi:hypothetical protein